MNNKLMKQELQPALQDANDLIISNELQYGIAGEMLKLVKGLGKKVKAELDPICEAANIAHKTATAKRKEHEVPLREAENIIKSKMLEYSGDNEVQQISGVSVKSKWTAKVVDFDKLPDKFKIADQKALDKIAGASQDLLTIPGVEFIEVKSMAVRA